MANYAMSNDVFESTVSEMSVSTRQARVACQEASMSAFCIYEDDAREALRRFSAISKAMTKDAALDAKKWGKWVQASANVLFANGVASKEGGRNTKAFLRMPIEEIGDWWLAGNTSPDQKTFGLAEAIAYLTKMSEDNLGKTTDVTEEAQAFAAAVLPIGIKQAELATMAKLNRRYGGEEEAEEVDDNDDGFTEFDKLEQPATAAVAT